MLRSKVHEKLLESVPRVVCVLYLPRRFWYDSKFLGSNLEWDAIAATKHVFVLFAFEQSLNGSQRDWIAVLVVGVVQIGHN